MTNTDSKAVTLYSEETQISPTCCHYPCTGNGKDYYGYMYALGGKAENHTPVRRYDTSAVTQIGVE